MPDVREPGIARIGREEESRSPRAVTMTGREESEIAMRETTDSPGGPGTGETVPTLGDPTALPGLETAAQGLFNYCPSTLLGAKAIQAVRGDGAPRLHDGSDRE